MGQKNKEVNPNPLAKTTRIDKNFFSRNRKALLDQLAPDSIALLGGNHPLYTNGDGVLPYVPNHDLWYFTGIEQDETLLLLAKTSRGYEEILFLRERNPQAELWDGRRLGPEEGTAISGISQVKGAGEWKEALKGWASRAHTLYLNLQEHSRAPFYRNRNHDLHDYCREYFPLHDYKRLAPIIHSLRSVKTPAEVEEIRRATAVSREALERILPLLRDGVSEKDIEAEMTAVYIRHGGDTAFSPIIASGISSCTLHYISNRNRLKSGEVILIDSGARAGEWGRYSADITRVFPVGGGEFTPRQRQVYEAVERILLQAAALVRPGLSFPEYKKKSVALVVEELMGLGLLKKEDLIDPQAHTRYFMHGISHWLGLDIHDVGGYEESFVEGMVLTCEPGIYIPAEGIGVRLENNLWIQSRKTENLTESIPLGVEEVYNWMRKNR